MNKTAVKNYAVWARNELKELVIQKAYEYEVTEANLPSFNADSVHGRLLDNNEKKQLKQLITEVRQNGFDHVVEEIAYTWFNRFIALRYMEVNNYLPQKIRVFTNENNEFKPEILTEAIHLEIEGLDKQKVFDFIEKNSQDDLYKYLLLTICNDMNQYLPDMFTSISDYKSLLMPDNLLKEDGILGRMITDIEEDAWTDQVQIIGWLYQYYNSELKDAVMKKKNYEKDDIPPVTQLFTPDWIVRYMTENSLGRLWIDGHPDFDHDSWKYYLEEAEQKPEVTEQLNRIREEHSKLRPEDIKVIDPCMGSGHILVYAFDVLMDIYRDNGYSDRDATRSILENNLYGLEIDERAYHLAYFALMMKARSYNRRILNTETKYNLVEIREPIGAIQSEYKEYLGEYNELAQYLVNVFQNAKELGSILNLNCTEEQLNKLKEHLDVLKEAAINKDLVAQSEINELNELLKPLIKQAKLLVQKYDVVITNPPYMTPSPKQKPYVQKNYPDSKFDLCSVFVDVSFNILKENSYSGIIAMQTWMSSSKYEKFRKKMISDRIIVNLTHLGTNAFEEVKGEVVQTASFITQNSKCGKYRGTYIRLIDYKDYNQKMVQFYSNKNHYIKQQYKFNEIPSSIIGYWKSEKLIDSFEEIKLESELVFRQGMATTDNDKYLRTWWEIDNNNIGFQISTRKESIESGFKWFPYQKGGEYRKWYGNNNYIVYYFNDGLELINLVKEKYPNISDPEFVIKNRNWYFKNGFTWSSIGDNLAVRYVDNGYIFDSKGSMAFPIGHTNIEYFIALLNSIVAKSYLDVLAQTLDFNIVSLKAVPLIFGSRDEIKIISDRCIKIERIDWDSFETSWDFKNHPLVKTHLSTIREAYNLWSKECEERFNTLKSNEEELNRIFIDIYGLQDELDPYVETKDVTVRKADLVRDIKSFISYAVGCMFGRYSLDKEGLIFAGGNFDKTYWKYKGEAALNLDGSLPSGGSYAGISLANLHYAAIRDNDDYNKATKLKYEPDIDDIIPICDEDYFEDDIVTRFVEFVKCAYGEDTLEENLQFIANALGGKGAPRDVLRNYFLNDFFKDHCNTYQVTGSGKRPIYWQFDSGKKNGFKALVYIHRYTPDLIARMRTGYIHPLQSQYRTQIDILNNQIDEAASTSEKVKLQKQLKKITEQSQELGKYEEKIHHWADKMEPMDLDDGVKANYAKFQDLLAKIK